MLIKACPLALRPLPCAGSGGGYGGYYGRRLQAADVRSDATLQQSVMKAEANCMRDGMSSAAFDNSVRE